MDDVTKKTIEELVLNFISEMNEWEKFCNNLKKENTQLSWNEKQDMMKQKVASIFIKYCTTVQRNYPIGSVDLNRNHSSDVLV